MTMPREVYYILQQAFSRTRSIEAEAVKLERQAEQLRENAMKIQQDAYDAIHAAYTNPKEQS